MKNKEPKSLTNSLLYKRFRQTVILDIIIKRFSDYFLLKNNIPKENSVIFFKNLSKYFQFVDFSNKTSNFFFTKFFGSAERKKVLNSFDLNSLSFQKFDEYSYQSKQNYSRLYFYFEMCFFFF